MDLPPLLKIDLNFWSEHNKLFPSITNSLRVEISIIFFLRVGISLVSSLKSFYYFGISKAFSLRVGIFLVFFLRSFYSFGISKAFSLRVGISSLVFFLKVEISMIFSLKVGISLVFSLRSFYSFGIFFLDFYLSRKFNVYSRFESYLSNALYIFLRSVNPFSFNIYF
jgi:hypothetical protein